ncbi:MAG: HAD family hydrolase [Oscillospiraceae bacterium]|jgi:phosphoglycolate phosphatase
MINTVIFDLDGTLLNTLADLTDAVNAAFRRFGYRERTERECASFLGHGFDELISKALPDGVEDTRKAEVTSAFRDYYMAHNAEKTQLYSGISELLDLLNAKGFRIAVVSNKGDEAVRALAADYFPGKAAVVVGEREGVRKKPAPDAVNEALRTLGAERTQAVYVGDSEVDAETAQNAALPCILVSWGYRERAFLETLDAAAIIDAPAELPAVLERL